MQKSVEAVREEEVKVLSRE